MPQCLYRLVALRYLSFVVKKNLFYRSHETAAAERHDEGVHGGYKEGSFTNRLTLGAETRKLKKKRERPLSGEARETL